MPTASWAANDKTNFGTKDWDKTVPFWKRAEWIEKQAAAEATMASEMEADRQRGLQAEAYRDYLRTQDGIQMRAALDAHFRPHNARLRALLGNRTLPPAWPQ